MRLRIVPFRSLVRPISACRTCLLDEFTELVLEENPDLSRGDAHDLAWEWGARADEAEH